jgi:hypothetical protein
MPESPAINLETPAKLMKWPSLKGERISPEDGAAPYTIVQASLADCVRRLLSKPESQRHLYEIHTSDGTVLSAANAIALHNDQPPSQEDLGGGDILSPRQEPSTDDQPLE